MKNIKRLLVTFIALVGVITLVACGGEKTELTGPASITVKVDESLVLNLNQDASKLEWIGQSDLLSLTVASEKITVKGLKAGTGKLTFTLKSDSKVKLEIPFTVNPKEAVNNGELIDFSQIITQKSTIRVWMDDQDGEYVAALIEEFNKVYPGIVVEFAHMGTVDSRERLKTYGPSGNGADVFMFPHDHLAQAVLEDLVYALPASTKTIVNERSHPLGASIATMFYNENTKTFDPEDPNAVETLFAVPINVESIGLFYNKDYVTTPATTMEQIVEEALVWNAQPVSETDTRTKAQAGRYYFNTSNHWADSYFMQPFYSAFGFTPFGPELNDPTQVGFINAVPALDYFVNTLKPITTGTGDHNSVGGTEFEAGNVPYIISGPWMHETYKDKGLNYGLALMPTLNGEAMSTFAGAQMVAVYKYSKNVEAAIKWVEFLTTDIAMEIQYEYKYKLPALKAELLDGIEGVSDDELMLIMSEQLETSVPMPTIPQVTYYWGPGETMIRQVWNTGQNTTTAANEAEQSYNTLAGLSGN